HVPRLTQTTAPTVKSVGRPARELTTRWGGGPIQHVSQPASSAARPTVTADTAAAGRLASIAAVNPSSITKKTTCQATVQRLSADPDRSLPNPGGEQRLATDRGAQGPGRHLMVPTHHLPRRAPSTRRLDPGSIRRA